MDKGRNTGDLVHQVSHECTGIHQELVLQSRCHHPMVLLGSVLHRRYHQPMFLWGTNLWWVWCDNTGLWCVECERSALLWVGFWHQCWSQGHIIHWVTQDYHHWTWWILGGSVWGCSICVCEVKTFHAALELLVINQSSLDWRMNPPLWRCGRFSELCWEGRGCWSFHSHSHRFIFLCKFSFKGIIQSSHEATKEYFFW